MFRTDAKPFADAIARVLPVIPRVHKCTLLTQCLITSLDGAVEITGTDLDLELRATVAVDAGRPLAIAVNPRVVLSILRSVPREVVTVAHQADGRLRLSWSDGSVLLPTMDAAAFPAMTVGEVAATASLPPTFVSDVLEPVSAAIPTSELRYFLNGVCIDVGSEKEPVLIATDGHRLIARGSQALATLAVGRPIVPSAFVKAWKAQRGAASTLTTFKGDKGGLVRARLDVDGIRITGNLIDGTYPDWTRVVPKLDGAGLRFHRAALLCALHRVVALPHVERVRFLPGNGTCRLENWAGLYGQIEVSVPYDGEPSTPVSFNPRYVIDAVRTARGEHVTLNGTGPAEPHTLTGSEDVDGTAVLMPLHDDQPAVQPVKRAA